MALHGVYREFSGFTLIIVSCFLFWSVYTYLPQYPEQTFSLSTILSQIFLDSFGLGSFYLFVLIFCLGLTFILAPRDLEAIKVLIITNQYFYNGKKINVIERVPYIIKKIPSIKVTDLATAVAPEASQKIIGIRAGEKLHEQMISADDAHHTYEYDGYFKVLPAIHNWGNDIQRIKYGKKVPQEFVYDSSTNSEWMSVEELREWIATNRDVIGTF